MGLWPLLYLGEILVAVRYIVVTDRGVHDTCGEWVKSYPQTLLVNHDLICYVIQVARGVFISGNVKNYFGVERSSRHSLVTLIQLVIS